MWSFFMSCWFSYSNQKYKKFLKPFANVVVISSSINLLLLKSVTYTFFKLAPYFLLLSLAPGDQIKAAAVAAQAEATTLYYCANL